MNKLCAFICLTAIIMGCGDDYYGPTTGNGETSVYNVETEPSISPDREYIYFISYDTATFRYSGIYQARINDPVRKKVLSGTTYSSPTVGFDNNTVAYLISGIVNYYDIGKDSAYRFDSVSSFESIVYISENVLLGCRKDSLFVINDAGANYFLTTGWDPTFVTADTFVYFDGEENNYNIYKNSIIFPGNPTHLLSVLIASKPRWPSYYPATGRLVYSIEYFASSEIFTYHPSDTGIIKLTVSDFVKPLILNNNLIIYSGPDGRFYRITNDGKTSSPYIHVVK